MLSRQLAGSRVPVGPLCYLHAVHSILQVLCYRYRDRPVSEQLSDSPALADPGVDWFRVEAQPVWKEKALKPDEVPKVRCT